MVSFTIIILQLNLGGGSEFFNSEKIRSNVPQQDSWQSRSANVILLGKNLCLKKQLVIEQRLFSSTGSDKRYTNHC